MWKRLDLMEKNPKQQAYLSEEEGQAKDMMV